MAERLAVGVDIGGTKVAAGVVNTDGQVVDKVKRPAPDSDPEGLLATACGAVAELQGRHPGIAAVGVGTAGFVDAERKVVIFAPNLSWRDEPLRDRMAERLGLPIVIENDANSWAWGEARFGAGRGCADQVCVTLGTGVGGGVVLGGQLYRGGYGLAAEVGHMRVVPGGRKCGCGNLGCWETYASGRALVAEARRRAEEEPRAAAVLLELGGGDPAAITGPDVTRAALAGDAAALAAFDVVGQWVGEGLAGLAAVLDPECFVIGGGVAEAGTILLEPARKAMLGLLQGRSDRQLPELRTAELGIDAAVMGAADLARSAAAAQTDTAEPASAQARPVR